MRRPVSQKDIATLPLRAIVAYAARCARKLQSLYCIPAPVYDNIKPKVRPQNISFNAQVIEAVILHAEKIGFSNVLEDHSLDATMADIVRSSDTIRRFSIRESRRFVAQPHTPGPNDTCIWYDRGLDEHAIYVVRAANAARAC